MVKNYIGVPDGTTEDLSNYVEIKKVIQFDFDSLEPRVLVGRKGSGKSFTQRKYVDASYGEADRFVLPYDNDPPDLDGILKFSAQMPVSSRTNIWQKIWEYAIYTSIATHLLYYEQFKMRFSGDRLAEAIRYIEQDRRPLLGFTTPTNVYTVVQAIISDFEEYTEFLDFYRSPDRSNFTNTVDRALRDSPIVCVYLDALDEELRRAPSLIVDITKALFYVCFKFARASGNKKKIHVMTTIRDIVYSTIIYASEHGDRYKDNPQVVELPWTPVATEKFTQKKAEAGLREYPSCRLAPQSKTPLGQLLGFEKIENIEKDFVEDIDRYMVRHTNCSPRTIVAMGNKIFESIDAEQTMDADLFRDIVNQYSKELANRVIKIASAYLVSCIYDDEIALLVENEANFREYVRSKNILSPEAFEQFSGAPMQSLTDGFVRPIVGFIQGIGTDEFSAAELSAAIDKFEGQNNDYREMNPQHVLGKIENVLWAQGLLGARYERRGEVRDEFFFFGRLNREAVLPRDPEMYVFCPGLVDACGLTPSKGVPVGYRFHGES
ncbi:P-loop ATPase, Sll1717 family [Actibacterium sp. XHP0104]|uniref:P-loop ATPase, Sll1717 family n=1 Tax=Actibacterium sp. XHP0104 TaxID=2984335 RepID=UPI0021E900B3|nr:hypothetical protein [Actibacterium sp. XHP0104]MCV2882156.1 hypothetical protein [Actibacterium sp. XHP0104]